MDINIKRAGPGDAELISRLSTVTFIDTFRGTCTDDDLEQFVKEAYNSALVSRELQDPLDFYFIALINDEAVGYLRIKEDESEVPVIKKYRGIEVKRLYVLKEFHDKKVGAALMQFAVNFAKEKGYEAIWLGVWEHNEKAKSFYKKWGYTFTGFTHDFPIGSTPQMDQWLLKIL